MLDIDKMISQAENRMLAAWDMGDERERKRQEEIVDALEELKWLRDCRREGLWDSKEAAVVALVGALCAVGLVAACGTIIMALLKFLIGG